MDRSRLRKRVLRNLLTAPWIVLPGLLGVAALGLSAVLGNPLGCLGVTGIACLAVSLIGLASELFLRSDRLTEQAAEDMRQEEEREHFTYLRQLQRGLRTEANPRTGFVVQEMRRIYQRLEHARVLGPCRRGDVLPEILDKAEALYRSCLASLQRALELSSAAQELATPEARKLVIESRDKLLAEVETSTRHLDATLDHLQTAALRSGPTEEDLARTRDELDAGLEIARRVEQRVGELEQGLKGPDIAREPPGH